jgi:hypothetical protein
MFENELVRDPTTLNQSPSAPTKQIKHLSLIFRASGLRFRSGATFGATSIIFFFEAGRGTGETVLSRLKQGFDSPWERQLNQILILNPGNDVQHVSNKRIRTGVDI